MPRTKQIDSFNAVSSELMRNGGGVVVAEKGRERGDGGKLTYPDSNQTHDLSM